MIQRRTHIKRSPLKRKPHTIKKVSDRRKEEGVIYSTTRKAYLKEHPVCEAKWDCVGAAATDIHHMNGRDGDYYLNQSSWLGVCRKCHIKIEMNPDEAKERGFSKSRMITSKKVILVKILQMANNFESDYNQMPIGGSQSEEGGPEKPANYKEVGTEKRQQWNNFIRWLNREKKVGGSEELDRRDRSRGLEYMEEYRRLNPGFKITADQIPSIQYEFSLLRDLNSLPDQQNLNPHVAEVINEHYKNRQISPVDGWIGSLTSKQTYPEILDFNDDPQKRKWGVDYTGASNYANQSNVWSKPPKKK